MGFYQNYFKLTKSYCFRRCAFAFANILCGIMLLIGCGKQEVIKKYETREVEAPAAPPGKASNSSTSKDSKSKQWSETTLALFASAKPSCTACHGPDSTLSSWKGAEDINSWATMLAQIDTRVSEKTMPPSVLSASSSTSLQQFLVAVKKDSEFVPMVLTPFEQSAKHCASCHGPASNFGWNSATTEMGWKQNLARIKSHVTAGTMPKSPLTANQKTDLLAYINSL